MSNTPNTKAISGGVPFGGQFVDIFRLTNAGDNTSGVKLGRYLIESVTPSVTAALHKRPNIDGGKNGWYIVEGDTEGSATIQRNTGATPSIGNGDYFDAAVRVGADGNPVPERFFIYQPNPNIDMNYRKVSVNVIVDTNALNINATDGNSPV